MEKTKNVNEKSSLMMTGNESVIYMVESFMEEHYAFRRNLLSGKTEMAVLLSEEETPNDEASSNAENGETSLQDGDLKWEVLTKEKVNSIVRTAKKMGVGGKKSPRQTSRSTSARMPSPTSTPSSRISGACPSGMARTMSQNSSEESQG